ncbi:MAG: ribulose-bisphosphate carboxylase large subunit [Dissulfurimicrobium sp.]|uniref:ribulose-bisphosphate carboxylase large subunit n=1 Tax=Dissulfurimicrobium hydrothermale TaxID=1750598 RepID=UPI003C709B5F
MGTITAEKGVKPYADAYFKPDMEPGDDYILVAFKIRPRKDVDIIEAASAACAESSTGTWTEIDREISGRLPSYVYRVEGDMAYVAYHPDLVEKGSLSNILSSLAGNIFGMKAVDGIRIEDMRFPKEIVKSFPGPVQGIQGVRELLGVYDRPLTGSTIKPKLGLTAKEHAKRCYETLRGGLDTVKDDENLGSQGFNPFDDRVRYTLEMVRKAEAETGERKGYWCNVTAGDTEEMLRRAALVKEHGGRFVMIDFVVAGFTAVASLRKEIERMGGLALHGHRAMHAAYDRVPYHGVDYRVISKWARMIGLDHIHMGTGVGKLEGTRTELAERLEILRERNSKVVNGMRFMQPWEDLKPVFPVASGGLHPGHVPILFDIFGKDAIWAFGGGVHGHPRGSQAGAAAVREAVEGVVAGKSLDQIARQSRELREALAIWAEVKF